MPVRRSAEMALAEGDAWVSSGPRSAAMLRSAPSPRDREPKFSFACGAHESNHFSPQHIKVLPLLGARPLVFLPMACGVEPTVVELRNVDTGEIDDRTASSRSAAPCSRSGS